MIIELYSMGEFQGYLKSIRGGRIYSTPDKKTAKTYKRKGNAAIVLDNIQMLTRGWMFGKIINLEG